MTERIYSTDAYAGRVDAVVLEVDHDDGRVLLDRTVFYPGGGGQPPDVGELHIGDDRLAVVRVAADGDDVWHWVEGNLPPPGTPLVGVVDWERRYRLMRTHTALHVLSAVIWRDWGAKVTGGNMEPGIARMDFELDAISVEFGQEVERRLNESLEEGHPVRVLLLPRAEALADPDLIRTKVNLIPDSVDPIRVIEIGTVDKQADGGTHVANTTEVGRVAVIKTESKGKGNKRMRIELAS
jgi:misacylated tRNA(Ala) deacylase